MVTSQPVKSAKQASDLVPAGRILAHHLTALSHQHLAVRQIGDRGQESNLVNSSCCAVDVGRRADLSHGGVHQDDGRADVEGIANDALVINYLKV